MEFTRELVRHSDIGEFITLKKIIEEEMKKRKKSQEDISPKPIKIVEPKESQKTLVEKVDLIIKPKKIESDKDKKSLSLKKDLWMKSIKPQLLLRPELPVPPVSKPKPIVRNLLPQKPKGPLLIPEPILPQRFQYLRPYATSFEMDLGKLNPLLKDPLVEIIEGNGPYEHVMVIGSMGRKPTDIVLSQEEMDEIVRKFSKTSKIPIHIGIYRVVVGGLILLAIVSEVINSKFIIKKIPRYSPNNPFYNKGINPMSRQNLPIHPQSYS